MHSIANGVVVAVAVATVVSTLSLHCHMASCWCRVVYSLPQQFMNTARHFSCTDLVVALACVHIFTYNAIHLDLLNYCRDLACSLLLLLSRIVLVV
jgi:hypothetical protein